MSAELSAFKFNGSVAERVFAGATCVGLSGVTFITGWFEPTSAGFFPACPLLKLTGIACPGCGSTRGMHALLHGDIVTALDYNVLLPFFLFFFGYLFISQFLVALRGRGFTYAIFSQKVIWGFFAFAMTFTLLRNLPWYPFNVLFP